MSYVWAILQADGAAGVTRAKTRDVKGELFARN